MSEEEEELIDETILPSVEEVPDKPSKREEVPPLPPLDDRPLSAWFLGPRAENAHLWQELISYIFQDYVHWRRNYFPNDPVVVSRFRRRSSQHEAWTDSLTSTLDSVLNQLKDHFPLHSPRYIAHMLSEQTLPAVHGYFAGMLFNPNNVTDEAAPITVDLELEVGRMIGEMLGYNPKRCWAHVTSGGTVANLEALWVARLVQFIPFVVREYCAANNIAFGIRFSEQDKCPITSIPDSCLIALRPNEAIFMLRKLARQLSREQKRPPEEVLRSINSHLQESQFNVATVGLTSILQRLSLRPVIFVSQTAHYSVAKAANILGYGERAVRLVPVDSRFRLDTNALKSMIAALRPDEYIAAVVGVLGSTEEGAVDPIHELQFLRNDLWARERKSFWLHVDAAWGGYIRALFCGLGLEREQQERPLKEIANDYIQAIHARERFYISMDARDGLMKEIEVRWAEEPIYSAFIALPDADSITVDPHKLGFVPYPAGVVAFRNGLMTELIVQEAQYISDEAGGLKGVDKLPGIDAVGPYIIEGSKPGAAALACWLAHKTIPLEVRGHGKVIRTTLLNARRLMRYLQHHRKLFRKIHREVFGSDTCAHPFTFVPLFTPDTNILCFVVRPMSWTTRGTGVALRPAALSLDSINRVNESIWEALSISRKQRHKRLSSGQPFYVSRTRFKPQQYHASSLVPVLRRIDVQEKEYRQHGLFVLRCAVMNPWYYEAEKAGMNYFYAFLQHLHEVSARAIETIHNALHGLSVTKDPGSL